MKRILGQAVNVCVCVGGGGGGTCYQLPHDRPGNTPPFGGVANDSTPDPVVETRRSALELASQANDRVYTMHTLHMCCLASMLLSVAHPSSMGST